MFDFESLKDLLVCPESKSKLVLDGQRLVSVDRQCRLSYPIRDEIPIMLLEEATQLPEDEWQAVMQRHSRDPETGDGIDGEDAELPGEEDESFRDDQG